MADEDKTPENNDFDAAWDEALGEAPDDADAAREDAEDSPDDDKSEDAPAEDGGKAEDESKEGDAGANEEPKDGTVPRPVYDSMMGRLKKEQEERKALEARLSALETKSAEPQAPAADAGSKALAFADLDEDVRESASELLSERPDLAPLILMGGRDGDKIRKALERGDVLIAESLADLYIERGNMAIERERARQANTATAGERHKAEVLAAHPDVVQIVTDPGFADWVRSQPKPVQAMIDQGSSQEVNWALSLFKSQSGKGVAGSPKASPPAPKSAPVNTVVKARSGGAPASPRNIDPNDFDSAWEAATKGG